MGKSENETLKIPEGKRIFDIVHLFRQIKAISSHGPFGCSIANMTIVGEKRKGLHSGFKLKCDMCDFASDLSTTDPDGQDINESMAVGIISTGIGFSAAEEIMALLNVPFMSFKTYQANHDKVADVIEDKAWSLIKEAAKEEAEIAKTLGEVDKTTGVPYITVVADGAWSKRSYNVNYDATSGVVGVKPRIHQSNVCVFEACLQKSFRKFHYVAHCCRETKMLLHVACFRSKGQT